MKYSFFIGTALGTVISLILTGILADNFGWASVFYIEGALCLIWCTAWWLMVEDSPDKQKRFITSEEREYILSSLNKSVGKSSHVLSLFTFQILGEISLNIIYLSERNIEDN